MNGIGKLYDVFSGELEFEGVFLKGKKWNGKGKCYNENFIILYEGEFLKGKLNGKGKEYKSRKLIFEGEYINGERWIGIDENGKAIFEINNGIKKIYN